MCTFNNLEAHETMLAPLTAKSTAWICPTKITNEVVNPILKYKNVA